MQPVMQRNEHDCLRACLASIFEVPWEDAPATTTPEDEKPQHNLVNEWLKDRGLVEWSLYGEKERGPLRRGESVAQDGTRTPADFTWPSPPATHYVGAGPSPRGNGIHHAVVMFCGRIVHDPHHDRDMTIDRIESIHVYVRRG